MQLQKGFDTIFNDIGRYFLEASKKLFFSLKINVAFLNILTFREYNTI